VPLDDELVVKLPLELLVELEPLLLAFPASLPPEVLPPLLVVSPNSGESGAEEQAPWTPQANTATEQQVMVRGRRAVGSADERYGCLYISGPLFPM
jgi:hypothetical protein